jgi:glycosyltransferase involved in cell wall biosynthesis
MRFWFIASRDWTNRDNAGGDIYLEHLARGLAKKGHKVTFVAASSHGFGRVETIDSIEVHRLKAGVLFPVRVFASFIKFRKSIDIVAEEVFGGKKVPPFAILYSRNHLIALWYQHHEKIFQEQYPKVLAKIFSIGEKLLARIYHDATIATLSTKSKSDLSKVGLNPRKMAVVPPAAFLDFPNQQTLPPFEKREDAMIFIGKIRKYKRVDHTILALRNLVSKGLAPRLIIAGNVSDQDRPYLFQMRELSERLGLGHLTDFKIYPGMIPSSEKLSLLMRSKVLLQPSPVEGFGMTVVEANSCGTPVVASDGVPADVIVHNENGFVYPFGNIEFLAQSIENVLYDSGAWERLSENGLKAARKFDWEASTDKFEVLAKNILHRTASASFP